MFLNVKMHKVSYGRHFYMLYTNKQGTNNVFRR